MATIDIKLKSYDELIFEITKLNTDKYLLEQENKQLKEEIEEQKKYNTELMLCNSGFNAILTELEDELNIAFKELQPGELVIGQNILKNIQITIQELKEKYK